MRKQHIILIIGVVLGIMAVILVNLYLSEREKVMKDEAKKELADSEANLAAVLQAKQDIAAGTVVEGDMFETAIIPAKYIQPKAVTSLDRISGMVTVAPIAKGEQISLNKLASTKDVGGLAEATPSGKRAITISVDIISSLVGMVKPGDYVDVVATIGVPVKTPDGKQATQMAVFPLFQNVLILAVGQEVGRGVVARNDPRYKAAAPQASSSLITVALSPQEANLIAFVQEQGKIRLVLRSPVDSKTTPLQPANWDTLFQYILPKPEDSGKKEPSEPIEYIEIYRGLSKEKIPITKK